MIPAGYLLKRTIPPPGWLAAPQITEVCSAAGCVNDTVADPRPHWKHNAFGLADDPETLWSLARESGTDTEGAQLYYYEAYECQIDSDGWIFDPASWVPLSLESDEAAPPQVTAPAAPVVEQLGFDVVVYGYGLEHSPLSCNGLAQSIPLNTHCLFDRLEQARLAIESGQFGGGCEEGTYRIFSVSRVLGDR